MRASAALASTQHGLGGRDVGLGAGEAVAIVLIFDAGEHFALLHHLADLRRALHELAGQPEAEVAFALRPDLADGDALVGLRGRLHRHGPDKLGFGHVPFDRRGLALCTVPDHRGGAAKCRQGCGDETMLAAPVVEECHVASIINVAAGEGRSS